MSAKFKREVKRIVKNLKRLGWEVERTNGGHFRAKSPNKDIPLIFIPYSPSEWRALKNLRALLKKHEVEV